MDSHPNFEGKTIAFSGATQSALAQALSQSFAAAGAATVSLPAAPLAEAPDADALVVLMPHATETPYLALDEHAWQHALQAGLMTFTRQIRELGRSMTERCQGCIIVVGGLSGTLGWPGYALSSALEGAMIALVRSLACEWAPHNVRLVFLACGAVETADTIPPPAFVDRTPLGHSATPEQIARIVHYLASDNASFTTGSIIRADGGWSAWGLLR